MHKLITILSLTFLFTLAGRTQQLMSEYQGTFRETKGTSNLTNGPVYLAFWHDGLFSINNSVGAVRGGFGTWTDKLGVRTFSVINASNTWSGTIRNGVVSGTFRSYVSGISGIFECRPPAP